MILAGGIAFNASLYDAAVQRTGIEGKFLLASRSYASIIEYVLERTPQRIPAVLDCKFPPGRMQIRNFDGQILEEIEQLAVPMFADEVRNEQK